MSDILNTVRNSQYTDTLRDILISKGCPICDGATMDDIADAINDNMVCESDPVVNAILVSGPGIKISPYERRGYTISATDEALISADISDRLPQGTSIHKALFDIVNKQIPCAMRRAAAAPSIVNIEVFRVAADGIDYYDNKAFPRRGQGRKSGLHPHSWYLKVYLFSQAEPLYVDLSDMVESIRKEILHKARHEYREAIRNAMNEHLMQVHGVSADDLDDYTPSGCPCCQGNITDEPEPEPEPEPQPMRILIGAADNDENDLVVTRNAEYDNDLYAWKGENDAVYYTVTEEPAANDELYTVDHELIEGVIVKQAPYVDPACPICGENCGCENGCENDEDFESDFNDIINNG